MLIGEPIVYGELPKTLITVIGQYELCQEVLRSVSDSTSVTALLRAEYLSIAETLLSMGISLGMMSLPRHKRYHDFRTIDRLAGLNNSGSVNLSSFTLKLPMKVSKFPRDYCTVSGDAILFNPSCFSRRKASPKDNIYVSPYGEGGRVLHSDQTVMVCEGHMNEEPTDYPDMEIWQGRELNVVMMPMVAARGSDGVMGWGQHIDRVGCLLKGKDGKLHFILDPKNQATIIVRKRWLWRRPKVYLVSVEDTLDEFARICDEAGIILHLPSELRVPGSLCLNQFDDGRVIMTAGDDPVAEMVSSIVGSENLFLTSVPIRWYPTIMAAGIRCLISDFPLSD